MQTMLKSDYHKRLMWIVPFLLFASMIIDAALPAIFPRAFLGNNQVIISHLAIYFLTFFTFYFRRSSFLWLGFLFGLLTDNYYSTVLGIYATLYFIIVLVLRRTEKYFPKNAIVQFMLFILAFSFVDFFVFSFYTEVGQATMDMTQFLTSRLGPTLIYNIVLFFVLYYPAKWLRSWLGYQDYLII